MGFARFLPVFIGFMVGLIVAIVVPLMVSGKQWQEKARARRLADAKMNARLLRFNL